MRQLPFLVGLAFAAVLSGCDEKTSEPQSDAQRPVLMTSVAEHAAYSLVFPGTVEPQVATQKAFRVPGQVIAKNVIVGDTVHKGDVLAVLDTTQLQQGVRSAEAGVASAQSQLSNAQSMADRAKALGKDGFASPAQLDSAQQSLAAANANVESAQAQLSKAREQLGYGQLIADYDGIVTAVNIEVGETVGAGTPAITIARPDLRDAVIDIPEDALALVHPGDAFQVATLLQPDVKIDGKVREIAPGAEQRTHTLRVKISIGNAPVNFRIGTTVSAEADKKGAGVISMPQSAAVEDQGKFFAWKFDPAGSTIGKVSITGHALDAGVFVIDSGLKAGDLVAVAGVHSLKDGEKVVRAEGIGQ